MVWDSNEKKGKGNRGIYIHVHVLFLVAANLVIVILVTVTSKTSYRGVPVRVCAQRCTCIIKKFGVYFYDYF